MAVTLLILTFILGVFFQQTYALNEFIPFVESSSCNPAGAVAQYFNISFLACKPCPQNTTVSADGMFCQSGHEVEVVRNLTVQFSVSRCSTTDNLVLYSVQY